MNTLQYFRNISVQISSNNKKLDIFEICTKRAVEKCPRLNFQTPRKPKSSKNKSGTSFAGHPVDTGMREEQNKQGEQKQQQNNTYKKITTTSKVQIQPKWEGNSKQGSTTNQRKLNEEEARTKKAEIVKRIQQRKGGER